MKSILENNLVFLWHELFKCFFLNSALGCFSICTLRRASCQDWCQIWKKEKKRRMNAWWCSKLSQVTEKISVISRPSSSQQQCRILFGISLVVSALHCNDLKDSNGYFDWTRKTFSFIRGIWVSHKSTYTQTLRQIKI